MTALGMLRQAAAACLVAATWHVQAASLQISPVTLSLDPTQRAASMTLRNEGTTPIYGQVRIYAWDQTLTEDVLSDTAALVASPPMIQIAPGGTQVVRLLQPDASHGAGERSYRLIIDEIAPPDPMRASGVQVRLRYSVPVFVGADPQAAVQDDLNWQVVQDGGGWALRVQNSGRHRAQLSDVFVVSKGQRRNVREGLLGYVLAGSARQWPLPFKPTGAGALTVQARVNSVPVTATAKPAPGK